MAALKASRAGTWRWDVPADRVEWDEALSAVYGLPHAAAPRTSGEFLQLIHPDDRERAGRLLGALLESGSEIEYEFRVVVGGRVVWIYDRSTLVRDAQGRPSYMTGACLDVTARKRIEEERDAALDRHRLLLRELTHRVTNHLQMIIAMLSLQQSRQADAAVRADFDRAIRRIRTLAGLHGQLYRNDDFAAVDMQAYLTGICDGLREAVLPDGPPQASRVALLCEAEPLRLSIDQAVPLGLIVSELATNAVKYAFADGRAGTVAVRLEAADDGQATLSVADDGSGLPPSAGQGGSGIGLGIVEALARQIGAEIGRTDAAGTAYRLRFTPSDRHAEG